MGPVQPLLIVLDIVQQSPGVILLVIEQRVDFLLAHAMVIMKLVIEQVIVFGFMEVIVHRWCPQCCWK